MKKRTPALIQRLADLRAEHRALMEQEYAKAEDVTRGAMLNSRGRAARIDPRDFFRSNWAYVKAYASPELIEYLELNPRLTFEQYERQMVDVLP